MEPRIVSPEEAWEANIYGKGPDYEALLHTVATEPKRIAAAVEAERERWMQMTAEQVDTARGLW